MAAYKVTAGEGKSTIVKGAFYDGDVESTYVCEFLWNMLKASPYHSSNLQWALGELNWGDLENLHGDEGCYFYEVTVDAEYCDQDTENQDEWVNETYWIHMEPA